MSCSKWIWICSETITRIPQSSPQTWQQPIHLSCGPINQSIDQRTSELTSEPTSQQQPLSPGTRSPGSGGQQAEAAEELCCCYCSWQKNRTVTCPYVSAWAVSVQISDHNKSCCNSPRSVLKHMSQDCCSYHLIITFKLFTHFIQLKRQNASAQLVDRRILFFISLHRCLFAKYIDLHHAILFSRKTTHIYQNGSSIRLQEIIIGTIIVSFIF